MHNTVCECKRLFFSPSLYLHYNLQCVQYYQRGLSSQVSIHHRLLLHLSFSPVGQHHI